MTRMEIVSGLKALQAHYEPTSPNHAVLEAALARIESRLFCEFFDKVRDMRMAQCAYFSTRTTDNLNRSKTLARALATRGVRHGTEESVIRTDADGRNRTNLVWDSVNDDLRRTVHEWSDDAKALHNCRKEFATMVCRQYGWEVGEIATGDTVKILQKSYVGKLIVDWRTL